MDNFEFEARIEIMKKRDDWAITNDETSGIIKRLEKWKKGDFTNE